jgi:starvation-inducible DNA-binding protein
MEIGMNQKARDKMAEGLQELLADSYALYLKTQNFHWNVTGSDFFALHIMFEKQYTEMSEAIDEIAERVRALGFFVDGSFTGFKKLTGIPEERRTPNAKEMLEKLVEGHEMLIRKTRTLATQAEKVKDQATVDLAARRLGTHEKFAWMLRSHL